MSKLDRIRISFQPKMLDPDSESMNPYPTHWLSLGSTSADAQLGMQLAGLEPDSIGAEAPESGFGCSPAPDSASPEKPHPPVCSAPLAEVSPEVYAWPVFPVPTADPWRACPFPAAPVFAHMPRFRPRPSCAPSGLPPLPFPPRRPGSATELNRTWLKIKILLGDAQKILKNFREKYCAVT
jgi:hypothetical protein